MRSLLPGLILLAPLSMVHAAASLYLSPAHANLSVGVPQVVTVLADTGDVQGNAVDADISYDPSALAVSGISKDGSVLSTWSTEPAATNGSIRFSGWADQRFSGHDKVVLRFTITPLSATQSSLQFRSGTLLSPDVQETNILASMRGASFSAAPASTVPSAPPQATTSAPVSPAIAPDPATSTGAANEALLIDQAVPIPDAQNQAAAAGSAAGGDLLILIGLVFVIIMLGAFVGYLFYRAGHE